MKKPRKAQITMFVIIGFVLLIIFILILFMNKLAKPKTNELGNLLNELEAGSIKNHITNCITQVAMDGLWKLGANGGVIYDFEGGTIPFKDMMLGRDYINYTYLNNPYFVAYALKKNTFCKNISYDVPDYPYPDKLLDELNIVYNSGCLYNSFYSAYDGFYGGNVMNKLCYVARESACEAFARGTEIGLTIQKQLEDHVAKKLPLCVNFSAFSARALVVITAEAEPVVEARIHDSEIIILVKFPVKISFEDQEPVTKIMDYQVNLNVRLGLIYNFMYNVFSKDSKNIGFNIKNEFISSNYWRQGLELRSIIHNPCSDCDLPFFHDHIVEVLDRESLVNGRPFLFRTAVENRRPALDVIEDITLDVSNTHWVDLLLHGFDPDDNNISYLFMSHGPLQGWYESSPQVLSNLEKGLLKFHITRRDYGKHRVGIIVLDQSGLFDYQWFWINIVDSSTDFPSDAGCVEDCVANNCESGWCKIAANQCRSECIGGGFESSGPCWDCVYSILHASDLEKHIGCSGIGDKNTCINNIPDCFWIIENKSNEFVESCYDDTALDLVVPPAYMIIK